MREYILADNRLAELAEWDFQLLGEELAALDIDLSDIGFDPSFLPKFEAKTDEDDVPELPATPTAKLGDIWQLGPHRVRCGDSCNPQDVTALLNGAKPHLMVTDPPYGIEYDASWRERAGVNQEGAATGKVLNDDRADWREAWALFPGEVAYVYHADKFSPTVGESLQSCGFALRNLIIWAKNTLVMSRGDYHHKHEPCWYAVRKGGTGHWNGDRKQSTVWDIDKPQKSETGHSTQKPVECMRRPIVNNSQAGDAVYDPFLGSGTTLIAAETEGRVCYGMELNPAYVDVIVARWEAFTGLKAELVANG